MGKAWTREDEVGFREHVQVRLDKHNRLFDKDRCGSRCGVIKLDGDGGDGMGILLSIQKFDALWE
ncbi:MAG: hypothetical protein ACUVT5_02455 [Candidatus Bathyarchaeales archaeon]